MFAIVYGTKNGETRRGPRLTQRLAVLEHGREPAMPDPINTPVRSQRSGGTIQPESVIASTAAAIEYCQERVEAARFLLVEHALGIEALDLTAEAHRQVAGLEALQRRDAGHALQERAPGRRHVVAERRSTCPSP